MFWFPCNTNLRSAATASSTFFSKRSPGKVKCFDLDFYREFSYTVLTEIRFAGILSGRCTILSYIGSFFFYVSMRDIALRSNTDEHFTDNAIA